MKVIWQSIKDPTEEYTLCEVCIYKVIDFCNIAEKEVYVSRDRNFRYRVGECKEFVLLANIQNINKIVNLIQDPPSPRHEVKVVR